MSSLGSADDLVDELVPDELEWRRIVRTYPLPALALAAVGGYVLGRRRGKAVLIALSTYAADVVTANINEMLGEELL